jgi:hypothetical protein
LSSLFVGALTGIVCGDISKTLDSVSLQHREGN